MTINYKNKKSKDEILNKAHNSSYNFEFLKNSSLLIKGDNINALSMLLKNYNGKIDLVYIDPPYNTESNYYISNERANSVSTEKNSKLAYSDKMTKDDYLEFIRERLILIRELLSDEGSIYLHIDYKIGHYVKIIMDEVFGESNFKNDITRIKSNPKNFFRKAYGNEKDMILFYSKNANNNIWNDIKIPLDSNEIIKKFNKIDDNGRRYTTIPLHAPGETKQGITGETWRGIPAPSGRHWRTNPKEFDKLDKNGDIEWSANGNPRIKKYADQHQGKKIQDIWKFKDPQKPIYPTEKNIKLIERIILQSSKKDSIILDCFSGSGTTLECANLLGRNWIGVDNSEVAIEVTKKRNIGNYKYFEIDSEGKICF